MDASGRTASKVNFSADGESRLRGRVNEKLKEFMGDYTDNTLVDYVIVLLRNGRQKEHARRELDVFLGDDAESFVSWLWDHLTTNLHLYMQSIGDAGVEELGKQVPLLDVASGDSESLFDHEKEKPARSRIRHNKEWKGLVHDDTKPIIMRSTIDDDGKFNDWHRSPVKESSSSKAQIQRKRDREDDESTLKREAAIRPKLVASRRLLQFALRDAVRTVQKVSPRPEPSLKRLRSIVSTSTFDTFSDEQPQRTKSIAITARAASIAVKAAADAAEDVFKSKGSGNVFDRLSHGSGGSYVYIKNPTAVEENEEGEDFDQNSRLKEYQQRGENMMGRDARHPTIVEGRTMLTSDSDSEDEDYTNMNSLNWANERSRSAEISSLEKDKDVTMTQQSIAQTADEATNTTLSSNVTPPITGSNALQKTLNISINVNTWKPQDYQEPDQHKEVRNQVNLQGKVEGTPKLNAQVIKDSCMDAPKKDETVRGSDPNGVKKPLPSSHGTYSGGRPADDADSRTVFVSNVHFAATKDTLSRHFNKFGEVLKVIIVTDATTGQPKGSAYVEFLRKESAELALSLNGTSFMSRIMKVVMRSAAHHEAAAMLSWPRMARSAFPSRLGRMPYSRGLMATNLRSRLTVKPGPRSLQWKRDNPGSASDEQKHLQNPSTPGGAAISPGGRNLTYIRPETKTDGRVEASSSSATKYLERAVNMELTERIDCYITSGVHGVDDSSALEPNPPLFWHQAL